MMLALVDCNNFYASCERVFEPSLKHKPVAILSNNDGCIVARSEEMKALGIKMGTPYFKAKKVIERYGGKVFSSNYELYGDMSNRVMSILNHFSANVEIYSIDEAFIEIPEKNLDNIEQFCKSIVQRVYKWTGIPVKIGVGETKTLAKLAAGQVKKEKILSGYKILDNKNELKVILSDTELIDIWGVGRRMYKKLAAMGIKTADRLVSMDVHDIHSRFNIMLVRTAMELQGIPCFNLESIPMQQKNLCYSRSFGTPISDYESLYQSVIYYASSAAAKLRKKKLKAQSITVYITTNYHNNNDKQYSNSKTITLPIAGNSSMMINKYAGLALKEIFKEGFTYKKSGVILNDLISEEIEQPDLFFGVDGIDDHLSKTVDYINQKFGTGTIKFAGEVGKSLKWQMRRNMASKQYTTNWDELLNI